MMRSIDWHLCPVLLLSALLGTPGWSLPTPEKVLLGLTEKPIVNRSLKELRAPLCTTYLVTRIEPGGDLLTLDDGSWWQIDPQDGWRLVHYVRGTRAALFFEQEGASARFSLVFGRARHTVPITPYLPPDTEFPRCRRVASVNQKTTKITLSDGTSWLSDEGPRFDPKAQHLTEDALVLLVARPTWLSSVAAVALLETKTWTVIPIRSSTESGVIPKRGSRLGLGNL